MNTDDLRQQLMAQGVTQNELQANPLKQFENWYSQTIASNIYEPGAMSLATVDSDGQPWQRIVLLKLFDEKGFVFFTNYESRKAQHMAANKKVSLLFPWHALGRQVKITGQAEKVSSAESLKYFSTRPRGSQIGAWASLQSEPLDSRESLIRRVQDLEDKYEDVEVPRPAHWTGYVLSPEAVEFWTQREFRLHDRFLYTLERGNWTMQRLNP